jgi:hypothetical protein
MNKIDTEDPSFEMFLRTISYEQLNFLKRAKDNYVRGEVATLTELEFKECNPRLTNSS